MTTFGSVVLLSLAIAFYLLPALIAEIRDVNHATAIFFINFLFGWTVLGWIAALIWAVVEKPREKIKPWSEMPPEEKKYQTVYRTPES